MPHSTQDSFDSAHTFDLTIPDDRPPTPPGVRTMKSQSRASSNAYGMAVTSAPNTERSMLPSQQKSRATPQHQPTASGDLKSLRRRSTPGTAEDYAAASMISRGEIEKLAQQHLQQKSQQQQRRSANLSHSDERNALNDDASKWRAQYYEDQLQYKDNAVTHAREKIQRQTPVIAELKTNVIIKDEFTLVTDLSYQLAQRYTRPDSRIMLKIEHSACLAMGATFEPCYILTINAVTSQMGPVTNKRNATLIQAFMADILSVPAERGIIKFLPIPEENFATGGTTILGEMEKAEKQERSSVKKTTEDTARKSAITNRKSMPKMDVAANGTSHVNDNARVNGSSQAKSNAHVNGSAHTKSNSHVNDTAHTDKTTSSNANVAANGKPLVNGNAHVNGDTQAQSNAQANESRADTPMEKKSSHDSSDGSQAERPKTAHGTGVAVDGLRMNPISAAELRGVATPQENNRRPKSVGAPVKSSMADQQQVRRDPLPRLANQSAQPPSTQTRSQPTKPKTLTKTQNSAPLAPRPVQVQLNPITTSSITTPFSPSSTTTKIQSPSAQEKQNKSVYMDMVTALPLKPESHSSISVYELDAARSNSTSDVTAAANTGAKRRSATVTSTKSAASKSFDPIPLMPPPPVEADETRSFSSRLSKRKSFLKMFKREGSVPAWYKQS